MEGSFSALHDQDPAVEDERVLLIRNPDAGEPRELDGLAQLLWMRLDQQGVVYNLNMEASTYEDAVRMTPDGDPDKPNHLNHLANSLRQRFERLSNIADLDKAISFQEDAARLTPEGHPYKPLYMNNLGISFLARFESLGETADLDKAVSAHDDAVRLTPEDHLDKPGRLNDLGNAFECRFERLGETADLDKAISAQHGAARLTPDSHHDKPASMNNLGNVFLARFECLGEISDLDNAVSAQNHAIHLTPDGHPDKPVYLTNLGNLFLARFERIGERLDLDKAVAAQDDAVRLVPDHNHDRPSCLNNLGIASLRRFERLGEIADVDKAVSAQYDAIQLTPDGHPDKPSYTNNLGLSFLARFERLGEITDLDKAVSAHDDAVRLTPDGHPHKPGRLGSLGNASLCRFERLEETADVDKAISAHDAAVRLTPNGHPDKPRHLNNLGNSFQARFELLEEVADIDRAISAQDDAVRLTPEGHPDKPGHMNNLGTSFLCRLERLGEVADLNKAVLCHDIAVQLTPDGHPGKPGRLTNLGSSLHKRFERFGDAEDLDNAILHSSCAARSAVSSASSRFSAATLWAKYTHGKGHTNHLEAYHQALDLLPRVAWLGLPVVERHRELATIGSIVCDAAAAAIEAEKYEAALKWLEQGRSIVWGQLLHLRTPVDYLRAVDPALADRLVRVSAQLERASTRDTNLQPNHQLLLEQAGRSHRELASEWDKLIEAARAVPGFEDFLRPKNLPQLRNAARSGPVVVINVHPERCDALIIKPDLDEVIHVPLDRLSLDRVQKLQRSLNELLSNAGVRVRGERGTTQPPRYVDGKFRRILSVTWGCIVKPVLEKLGFSVSRSPERPSAELPRIWWCPTGPLTFLPLHAAGSYGMNKLGPKTADFVISSYTPTLTALLETPRTTPLSKFQLLAITQPSTPRQGPLPNTKEELKLIRQRAVGQPFTSLEGVEATVERVVRGMNESSWIHLACHGTQNVKNPTQSALLLQDGQLMLSEIIKMSLPHADFAFLSACQTATGDTTLTEEAVHLAAGMLLAGYRGVIATTWSIKDNDAPLVADEVYSRLFEDGQPDRTRAAHALHHAVRLLQERGAPFFSWVPFIHVGF